MKPIYMDDITLMPDTFNIRHEGNEIVKLETTTLYLISECKLDLKAANCKDLLCIKAVSYKLIPEIRKDLTGEMCVSLIPVLTTVLKASVQNQTFISDLIISREKFLNLQFISKIL